MEAAFSRPDLSAGVTDMCRHGKRRPGNKVLIKKPTLVKGTPEVCRAVEGRCLGNHSHTPIVGTMKAEINGKVKSLKVSGRQSIAP